VASEAATEAKSAASKLTQSGHAPVIGNKPAAVATAAQLRSQIADSTDPARLERLAREAEGALEAHISNLEKP
jgi:hypothetical protein